MQFVDKLTACLMSTVLIHANVTGPADCNLINMKQGEEATKEGKWVTQASAGNRKDYIMLIELTLTGGHTASRK